MQLDSGLFLPLLIRFDIVHQKPHLFVENDHIAQHHQVLVLNQDQHIFGDVVQLDQGLDADVARTQ